MTELLFAAACGKQEPRCSAAGAPCPWKHRLLRPLFIPPLERVGGHVFNEWFQRCREIHRGELRMLPALFFLGELDQDLQRLICAS